MQDLSFPRSVACLVCGGNRQRTLWPATFTGSATEAPPYFLAQRERVVHGRIVACEVCGFVFTNPQFQTGEYRAIYMAVSADFAATASLDSADSMRFRRLAAFVRQYSTPGAFLDFGCGRGRFLEAMNDPQGIGFEVGTAGEDQSSGFRIVTGDFLTRIDQEPFAEAAFSFVTAFDVFEHLPDLDQYIRALRQLIKPGGTLIATLPNIESLVAKLSGERWSMILLEHLWYFSPRTLTRFLKPLGFRLEHVAPMPYAASLSHLFNRFAQTYQVPLPNLPTPLSRLVLRIPVGLMAVVLRRT